MLLLAKQGEWSYAQPVAISVAKDDSDKVLRDMLAETKRHGKKKTSLVAKQTDLNEEYVGAAKLVDAVADAEESEARALADGEEQTGAADAVEEQTLAIADGEEQTGAAAAVKEPPASGAGSSTDKICPAAGDVQTGAAAVGKLPASGAGSSTDKICLGGA